MLGVLVEPILPLSLWVAAQVSNSYRFIPFHHAHSPRLRLATFIEMGKLPFDSGGKRSRSCRKAVDRIQSGSGFVVLKWGISLKQLVVLQMFVGVFRRGDRWKPSAQADCCWRW